MFQKAEKQKSRKAEKQKDDIFSLSPPTMPLQAAHT
jgi:hypothetical protein